MNENFRIFKVLFLRPFWTFLFLYLFSDGVYEMLSYNGCKTTGVVEGVGLVGGGVAYSYCVNRDIYKGRSAWPDGIEFVGDPIEVFYSKHFPWISSTRCDFGEKLLPLAFSFFVLALGCLFIWAFEREYEICNSSVVVRSGGSSQAVDITVEEN
jgi:hypothetical protein